MKISASCSTSWSQHVLEDPDATSSAASSPPPKATPPGERARGGGVPREQRAREPAEVRDRPAELLRLWNAIEEDGWRARRRSTTRTCAAIPTRRRPTSTSPPTGPAWSGSSSGSPTGGAAGALLSDRRRRVLRWAIAGGGDRERGAARVPALRALLRRAASASAPTAACRSCTRGGASRRAQRAPAQGAQDQASVHRRASS